MAAITKATLFRTTAVTMAMAGLTLFGNGVEASDVHPAPPAPPAVCCEAGERIAGRSVGSIRELSRDGEFVSISDEVARVIGGIQPQVERGTTVVGRWTP